VPLVTVPVYRAPRQIAAAVPSAAERNSLWTSGELSHILR
jgi:hypothetical protein